MAPLLHDRSPAAPDAAGDAAPAIAVSGVSRTFGPTRALIDVSMTVAPGEARALLGRNGAGKSTLVSLLTGLDRPDAGEIHIAGAAASAGMSAVACVYQRSRLVPAMTAAENVMITSYPRRLGRLVDWRALRATARGHLASWGLEHVADVPVEALDPVQAKVVEICRALTQDPDVLLLDEPTAGLDKRDAERLFAVVDELRARGVTLVYVSHHLDEVYRLCDSATVLRDARVVVTAPLPDLPMRALVDAMVGAEARPESAAHALDAPEAQDLPPAARRADAATDRPVRLRVRGLAVPGRLDGFDLEARAGECVGIAGIDGSGKAEVGSVLAGLLRPAAGTVEVDGRAVRAGDVRAALEAGLAYVPEDRHARGMVPNLSVAENATMTAARRLVRRGVLRIADREDAYRRLADDWSIVAASPAQPISELSGGNQQKCVMARALATDPSVLVLHNPTAGVDVAAKASIMGTLEQVLADGSTVVVVSEDPDDFALCARILVIVKGRVATRLQSSWTEADLVSAMQGADL